MNEPSHNQPLAQIEEANPIEGGREGLQQWLGILENKQREEMKLNLDDTMMLQLVLVLVPSGRGREASLDLAAVRGGRGPW